MSATSTPSQHQLRAELEAMVLSDLLVPAGGESEELTERSVRERYFVGVLAPSREVRDKGRRTSRAESDSPQTTHPLTRMTNRKGKEGMGRQDLIVWLDGRLLPKVASKGRRAGVGPRLGPLVTGSSDGAVP